uniref:Uncharacterized protein 65E11.050 n=1 Tax=Neurospora crassa TaxID=5141 RepID=Q96UB9_NEUCS|nr:conserved hypothetical protein [Neurospora crassa]
MDWFGRAKISFTHHTSPLTLQQKDGTTTDLLKVCEQATPPCQLNPLLFNGHVQTMWTVVKEHGPQIYYRRKIFDSDHKLYAGTFTVDFVTEPHQDFEEKLPPRTAYFSEQDFANLPSDDSKPMLIVLHGNFFEPPLMYPIQYVGEEGEGCLLKGAVAVGNPFNLDVTNRALRRTHLGRLYQRVMGTNMKKLVANHKETVLKYTNLDYDRIQNITYLNEFDREVQTVTWGYPTEDAYYRDASSCDAVLGIRIPFMALSAADDPIAVEEAIPYQEIKQNPYTVLCLTSLGGHLSWFELGGGRWHTRPICNFLNKMAFDIDLDAIKPDACDKFDSQFRTHFDPVQRKLQILDVDQ